MSKIEFILRQHTPIIHFQWHEKDATIRPTELKAKLDKWLIATLENEHRGADERLSAAMRNVNLKKWLRGANVKDKCNPAFNYSVKVAAIFLPSTLLASLLGMNMFDRLKFSTDLDWNGIGWMAIVLLPLLIMGVINFSVLKVVFTNRKIK